MIYNKGYYKTIKNYKRKNIMEYKGSCHKKHKIKHLVCKTEFEVRPNDFQQGRRCILCFGRKKLDYLQALGVDYIWLTPFYVSPQNDNGYDVADYYKINPQFGTMEDMDELIRECDNRGIGLMLDMVFNHTSTEHEWFRRALAGEKNIRTTTYSGMNRKIRFRQTGSQNSAVLHGSMYHH